MSGRRTIRPPLGAGVVTVILLGLAWALIRTQAPDLSLLQSGGLAGCLVFGAAWLGWSFRQAWIYPRWLQDAEAHWIAQAPLEAVQTRLDRGRLARGETGYRISLLEGHLRMAAWDRTGAWAAYRQAHLNRLPFWIRGSVERFLARTDAPADPARLRRGQILLRLAPRMPHLHLAHARTLMQVRRLREARHHLREAASYGAEDPLLLDMLLREAILAAAPEAPPEDPTAFPPLSPRARSLLDSLLDRHGDPRIAWGRGLPARRLVAERDLETAFRVTRSLPPEYRLDPWIWTAEIEALRRLGDHEAAWNLLEDALVYLPASPHLWLARLDQAMEDQRDEAARAAVQWLEAFWAPTSAPRDPELHSEWLLLHAEYLFDVEGNAAAAKAIFDGLPQDWRTGPAATLEIELDIALGNHFAAYAKVQRLRAFQPLDPELMRLEGDCLAGMEEWANLERFLEGLEPAVAGQAPFLHLRGLAKAHRNDAHGAREDLERAAFLDPQDLRFALDAGHACMELGEWSRAEGYWRHALARDERSEEALLQLAETRSALHDPEGARRYLRECLLHHPESEDAQRFLAELESN